MPQRRQRRFAGRVDEQPGDVVEELVADRPIDRPVLAAARRPPGSSPPRPARAARPQPLQVLQRIRQPVGVVDAQAIDQPLRGKAQHEPGHRLEHGRILDPHRGQLVDVEEPRGGGPSQDRRRRTADGAPDPPSTDCRRRRTCGSARRRARRPSPPRQPRRATGSRRDRPTPTRTVSGRSRRSRASTPAASLERRRQVQV